MKEHSDFLGKDFNRLGQKAFTDSIIRERTVYLEEKIALGAPLQIGTDGDRQVKKFAGGVFAGFLLFEYQYDEDEVTFERTFPANVGKKTVTEGHIIVKTSVNVTKNERVALTTAGDITTATAAAAGSFLLDARFDEAALANEEVPIIITSLKTEVK